MTRLDWLPKQPWWETWWIPGIQSSLIIFCHCPCSHVSMAINSRHQKLYICISLVAHRSVTENGLKRQGTRLLEINRVPLTSNIIPLTIFLCLILHLPKHTLHISGCDQHTWFFVTIFYKSGRLEGFTASQDVRVGLSASYVQEWGGVQGKVPCRRWVQKSQVKSGPKFLDVVLKRTSAFVLRLTHLKKRN